MVVTLINDCSDSNAFGRQVARIGSFIPNSTVNTVGLKNYSDVEAAGNLIDCIDAYGESEGIIIVNSAPRHGSAKKWKNGSPFGYFYYKNLLIVSTIDGYTLSLAKKFGLIEELFIVDIPVVVDFAIKENLIDVQTGNYIINTQFRSFDFEPRLAKWLKEGIDVPSEIYPLENIADIGNRIWFVDNFGNTKTTMIKDDVDLEGGFYKSEVLGKIKHYTSLKDVPDNETAITVGSSGLGSRRFLEIIIQGKNASQVLNIKEGDLI